MKAFKGFDKDLKCKGFQYKEGKTYEHTGELKCCPTEEEAKKGIGGFHACENPLDVLNYYDICDSVFHEVEMSGNTKKNEDGDSKFVASKISIGKKLSLKDFINTAVEFIKCSCNAKIGRAHV